jgi:hypothetical protein
MDVLVVAADGVALIVVQKNSGGVLGAIEFRWGDRAEQADVADKLSFPGTDGGGVGCGRLQVCVADNGTPSNDGEQAATTYTVGGC